jgi:hypothetical protein
MNIYNIYTVEDKLIAAEEIRKYTEQVDRQKEQMMPEVKQKEKELFGVEKSSKKLRKQISR